MHEVVGCPVIALSEASVILSLRAWCADAATAKQVEWDLYEAAKKRFDREGIEIPFPSTNVILKRPGLDGQEVAPVVKPS